MNCREVEDRLSDWIDGELAASESQELAQHLEGCARCRQEEQGLRRIVATASTLPRELQPARDLWPGIERELPAARSGRPLHWHRHWPILAVALPTAAAILIAVGIWLGRHTPDGAPSVGAGAFEITPVALEGLPQPAREAELEYERATRDLLAALPVRRASLSADTAATVERNVRIIDQALGELRQALRREPSDPQLMHLLVATHQQRLNVVRRATRASAQI
jgi:hypothetical protein